MFGIAYNLSDFVDADSFSVLMNAVNGTMNLTFHQRFSSDVYVKAFMEMMDEGKITYEYLGCEPFVTPKVVFDFEE